MKRTTALFLLAVILISLFSGCSAGEYETQAATTDYPSTLEIPEEVPHLTVFSINYTDSASFMTAAEALDKLFYEEYGVAIDRTLVTADNMQTVLNSRITAGTIADCFISGGFVPDINLAYFMNEGKFQSIDEILKYSDGTAEKLFGKDGIYSQLRAETVYEDGNFYEIIMPKAKNKAINISDGKYLTNYSTNYWYTLNIRADWLEKLGLDMPKSPDEFYNALEAFQSNDMNGNGKPDERAFVGMGKSDYVFANGIAGWYGLPRGNFVQDNATGKVVNAIEAEGYKDYIQYAKKLYDAQLTYVTDNVFGSYLTDITANTASVYLMYPDILAVANTGDPDCRYEPVPVIQALPGIAPHVVTHMDSNSKDAGYAISFRADADPEICAKFLDFIAGESFYMTMEYGEKGIAWDYVNGEAQVLDPEKDPLGPRKNTMASGLNTNWMAYPVIDTSEVYGEPTVIYNGIADAIEKGEPYLSNGTTYDEWKAANGEEKSRLHNYLDSIVEFGEDNIVFETDYEAFGFASPEEYDTVSMYATSIKTYFNELTAGYITGNKSLDSYEDDMQEAYDTYKLAEFMDALQAKCDRFIAELNR